MAASHLSATACSRAAASMRRMPARLARIHSQPIHRALHAQRTSLHHVEINHRRPDIPMTEQLLYCANVVPIFKQTGPERVTQHVRAETLRDPSQRLPFATALCTTDS